MTKLNLKEEWKDDFPIHKVGIENFKVPIVWKLVPFKLENGVLQFGSGKRKIFLGFCLATEQLIRMEATEGLGLLAALIVKDCFIEVKDGVPTNCEENRRCLNIDCKLNHTTKNSYLINPKLAINWVALTSYRKMKFQDTCLPQEAQNEAKT